MKTRLILVASLGAALGIVCLSTSRGQAPSAAPLSEPAYGTVAQAAPARYSVQDSATQAEIGRLMKELRETDDEAKKGELTKKLEAAVSKHFDEDLKARQAELTKLEERLKKLRGQLDRRVKAKNGIVELQTKVLLNEAEGLGFQGASFFEHGGRLFYAPVMPGAYPTPRTPAKVAKPALPRSPSDAPQGR